MALVAAEAGYSPATLHVSHYSYHSLNLAQPRACLPSLQLLGSEDGAGGSGTVASLGSTQVLRSTKRHTKGIVETQIPYSHIICIY